MKCDACHDDCGEIAFQCINCKHEFTLCLGCMPRATDGTGGLAGVAAAKDHDGTHVFRIIGQWRMEDGDGGGGGAATT